MTPVNNPVLTGFHPDPSICRVGDDYYLVTSTFVLFPGLALHHSRDLVHWRPIGAALTRPEQLELDGLSYTAGIYAPTLRHHEGVFYLITTLVGAESSRNFVVTANDPAGPWSNPVWLDDAPGFDPSLLFDDDGRVWCCGTWLPDPEARPGRTEVWLQELDLPTLSLLGDRHVIWRGAAADARWVEGPHVYRVGDGYVLLAAEGGTEWQHAVVTARATTVTGPYVTTQDNPVLTARHLGRTAAVAALGHADLVQTAAGDWWAVLIGVRPGGGQWWPTGRETFLVPVEFVDGWPLFNPGLGSAVHGIDPPHVPAVAWPTGPPVDDFGDAELGPEWVQLRTPRETWWSLRERPGQLRLSCRGDDLAGAGNPSFLARRVRQRDWSAYTCVELTAAVPEDHAGVAVFAGDAAHLRIEVTGGGIVQTVVVVDGVAHVQATAPFRGGAVVLGIEARGTVAVVRFRAASDGWQELATVDLSPLSPDVNRWFLGLLVGVFAVGAGGHADIDWFSYSDT